jgi:hypothetical protein
MRSLFLEKELTTQWHHSLKLGIDCYTLVKEVMRCVWDMVLQSMEKGKEDLLSTQHIWKGLVKSRLRDSDVSLLLIKRSRCPLCPFQCHHTLLPGHLKPRKTDRKTG